MPQIAPQIFAEEVFWVSTVVGLPPVRCPIGRVCLVRVEQLLALEGWRAQRPMQQGINDEQALASRVRGPH